jgi:transcriptional regulator with XRE-family HTH domain
MTPKMPEVGPVGWNLIANVDRLRQARRVSYRKLSAALEAAGRPIPALGLTRMAHGQRRVDVDELVALAAVFGVAPAELLTAPGGDTAGHPVTLAARELAARAADLVAAAGDPQAAAQASARVDRAIRRVQLEAEELLDTTGRTPP